MATINVYHGVHIELCSEPMNVTVGVGDSYNFSCDGSNYNRQVWGFRNGIYKFFALVRNSSDGRRVVTRGHDNALQLQLWNIQLHDAGKYKCILTNNLERISITNYLRVLGEIFKVAIRKLNARVIRYVEQTH